MTWYAKPSGSYGIESDEAKANMVEMYGLLNAAGYTLEAVSGILGNVFAESGLNPWRWQNDYYAPEINGYGLFQYSPGEDYIALSGTTPNLSTSTQTSGATAADGAKQTEVFYNNTLGKWVSSCWRIYWSKTAYASLYAYRNKLVSQYGSGGTISLEEFAAVDDIQAAAFIYLACFEGPQIPNYDTRYSYAQTIYSILSGEDPPEPKPPTPGKLNIPIWMLFKFQRGLKN